MKPYISTPLLILAFCLSGNIVTYAQPLQIIASSVTSSVPPQPGNEPSKCIDGDDNTIFHTRWDINGIPDTLDFYFAHVQNINSIEYTPRLTGLNGVWGNIEIWYSTVAAPTIFSKITSLSWTQNNTKKSYNFPATGVNNPYIIRIVVNSGSGNFSSCAEMKFFSDQVAQSDCAIDVSQLPALGDSQIKIVGGIASSYQTGTNIDKSYDGDNNTIYHSSWSGGGFPISLKYAFNNAATMDYMVYIPRLDGNLNGRFGNIEIWYRTHTGNSFIKLMDFDCQQNASPSRIIFPAAIQNIDTVMVKVLNGGNNFASCAEMQFYASINQGDLPYLNIFVDKLYSALLPSITQASIDTISSSFFRSLAQCIFNGTYNQQFRVQNYDVYPMVNTTSTNLKIGTYNQFENPTGILFESNTKAVVFVDDYTGPGISMRVRNFSADAGAADNIYQLSPGYNLINIKDSGLAYINYYNDNNTLSPIKINIVTGKVNGYFDVAKDNNLDWISSLNNSTYPMLDIKGKYLNLMYYKLPLKQECPSNGLGLVAAYDSIVKTEFELMGLTKYNKIPKNHMFAYTEKSGGYFAGGTGAHYDLSWGYGAIANISNMDLWGIAHELGHINQVRPGMKWIGMTEVTNNLYSAWCQYTMRRDGQSITRLETDNGQADASSPNIKGGRFNSYLDASLVNNQHIQSQNVFNILTPLWQLELYYQAAGALRNAPTLLDEMKGIVPPPSNGVDYAHWLADVFEKVRNTNEIGLSNGQLLLNFVKNTCDAVHEDLTDFFIRTGFLRAIDTTINDYVTGQLTITQQDIQNTVNSIKAKGYAQPVSPVIYYLSANSVGAFKNQLPASGRTGFGVSLNSGGKSINIQNTEWKNVAAYETYAGGATPIHITIAGTGAADNSFTTVQYPGIATSIYAVGFDGNKILVFPVGALPVKFVNVKATISSNNVNSITWETDYERDVDSFEIQRSLDGNTFIKAGSIKASNLSKYQFSDNYIFPNGTSIIYYRIKAVNINGSPDYSNIVSLHFYPVSGIVRFQNPFTNKLKITFENTSNTVKVRLINMDGSVILTNERANQSELELNVSNLPSGIYLLQIVKADGSSMTYKVVKAN